MMNPVTCSSLPLPGGRPGRPHPGVCRPGWARLVAAVLLAGVLAGCGGKKTAPNAETAETADPGVESVVTRGPVRVRVHADRKSLTIAQRLTLTLTADYDQGYEVAFPKFGDKLEQFGIVDFREAEPVLSPEGRIRAQRTYVLEPFLSGVYTIPAMTFTFHQPDREKPGAHSLETTPLKIEVRSLLPEERKKLDLEPLEGPVALPPPPLPWPWIIGSGLALLGLALAAAIWLYRRRATAPPPPPPPAHEIAYAALRALVAEDLVGQGRVKEFYRRISDILRQYIENRFHLHAPERTTEEFLAELGAGDSLVRAHQRLLRDFLVHCDLVKFAEHDPTPEEIQQTFDACSAFIEQTRTHAAESPDREAAS